MANKSGALNDSLQAFYPFLNRYEAALALNIPGINL